MREDWYKRQIELGIIPPDTELAPRNPGVKPWDELSEKEQKFALALQEAFAGFLDHTDQQIGRLLTFLESIGEKDNTIVMLLSDNGASQEGGASGVMDEFKYFNRVPEDIDAIQDRLHEIGGPHSHSNIPWGWAMAGNTPLKWYKQNTFGGGVRDPLIIRWPEKIKDQDGIRKQFHHVSDIVPTILELTGIEPASSYKGYEQMPITGASLAYSFDSPHAPSRKEVQYFEMYGHRGIWADGWKAVTYHTQGQPFNDNEWELYNLEEDFSECHDLAEKYPEKLREMIELFWVEAGRQGVLPLDDRTSELWKARFAPGTPHATRHYTYYPPISHLPAEASPLLGGRSWIMSADVELPVASVEGVLVAQGTQNVGFSLYIKDNRLVFDYNIFTNHFVVRSECKVPTGRCMLGVRFIREDKTATITLLINDEACGSIEVPFVLRMISSTGMDIGRNALSPVTDDYDAPFPFTGVFRRLDIDLLRHQHPGLEE